MTVVLNFRDVWDHPLGEFEHVDADTLAEVLQAEPSSVPARELASTLHTATRTAAEHGTSETVTIDREQLEAVHRACTESPALQDEERAPSLKQLCAKVALLVVGREGTA